MTTFAHEVVQTGSGPLHLDGNSKVTADDGSYEAPVANAFSLPHKSTCPGSTPACRDACFVNGMPDRAGDLDMYALYRENERVMHRVLLSRPRQREASRALAANVTDRGITRFRWHVSGDVFSTRYADWIADTCWEMPQVKCWIYTRTYSAVPHLMAAPNLVVNVSADRDCLSDALMVMRRYGGLRLCYLSRDGETPPEAEVLFPDYALRGRDLDDPTEAPWWQGLTQAERRKVCPADFFGQSRSHRCGPCKKCF